MFRELTLHKNWKINLGVIVLVLFFAIERLRFPNHGLSLFGTYEAFAHIFVGFLIGVWCITKDNFYLYTMIFLTAVEVFKFIAG